MIIFLKTPLYFCVILFSKSGKNFTGRRHCLSATKSKMLLLINTNLGPLKSATSSLFIPVKKSIIRKSFCIYFHWNNVFSDKKVKSNRVCLQGITTLICYWSFFVLVFFFRLTLELWEYLGLQNVWSVVSCRRCYFLESLWNPLKQFVLPHSRLISV